VILPVGSGNIGGTEGEQGHLGPDFLNVPEQVGGGGRIRTGDRGFAGPCLTTWLRRHPTTRCRGLGFDVGSKL
jgi:hypothetical protein